MLEPHNRRDLIESLKPPAGYTLDYAVGTSYTLDLLTVLIAPLALPFLAGKVMTWKEKQTLVVGLTTHLSPIFG